MVGLTSIDARYPRCYHGVTKRRIVEAHMAERWTGLKMMVFALIAIVILGRLLFHVASITLVLFVLVAVLFLLFYAGTKAVIRK